MCPLRFSRCLGFYLGSFLRIEDGFLRQFDSCYSSGKVVFHISTESPWITELPVKAPVIGQFCLSFRLEKFRVQSLQELRIAANGLLPGRLVVLRNGRRVKSFRRDFLQWSRISFGNRAKGMNRVPLNANSHLPAFSVSCWGKFVRNPF